jgi:hypothetical protein
MTTRQSRRTFIKHIGEIGVTLAGVGLFLDACEITLPASTAVMTSFNPSIHGFKFSNDFTNDFVPALDIHTGGLCGGMSYTALDYYNAKTPIPNQTYRPANGNVLENYLYGRQTESITNNLNNWAAMGFNPFGSRDSELFNLGLQSSAWIGMLRKAIDAGTPTVLGLQGAGSEGQHQVVAYGYDLGRYRGDLGNYETDFKIFVDDPNYPATGRTLIPDVANKVYKYQEGGSETWRTYFVDTSYQAKTPPNLPNPNYPNDGLIHGLLFQFFTGVDDFDGGYSLDIILNLGDGTQQVYDNVNLSARWISNYDQTVPIMLQTPVQSSNIHSIDLRTSFPGGLFGKNWDMQKLIISVVSSDGTNPQIKTAGPTKFTGDFHTLTIPLP